MLNFATECFHMGDIVTHLNIYVFMFGLETPEILLIALVVLLLFGGKKIPELMKGLGKGVKSFKEGMKSLEDDEENGKNTDEAKKE